MYLIITIQIRPSAEIIAGWFGFVHCAWRHFQQYYVIMCTAGMGNVLRTSVCTSPTVLEVEVLLSGLEFVMMVALNSKWTRMWFWFRKSWQTWATWHLALSCWKTWSKFRCCRKGRTIGSRISSVFYGIQCISFLVMNPDFHFILAMDVIMCTAGVGNVLRTSVCTSTTVSEADKSHGPMVLLRIGPTGDWTPSTESRFM
jgi:hypothetical protein